jgi:hypothetical protein
MMFLATQSAAKAFKQKVRQRSSSFHISLGEVNRRDIPNGKPGTRT